MNKVYSDLIYLLSCVLNCSVPSPQRVEDMDLEQLYRAATSHMLGSITASALERAGVFDEKFTIEKEKATRKNIFLDVERKKLFEFFEQNRIWYMPLKGVILKEIYPEFSMRQMSDNDILFDENFRKNVKEYFEQNGYKTTLYNQYNHDCYEKPPVLNFEMHVSLISEEVHADLVGDYYNNVKKRLVKDENNGFGYHFTDEDFYIFMILHEYKHYNASGTGLRSLVDKYVYLNAKQPILDWNYVQAECEKVGISNFEQRSRTLALKTFSNDEEMSQDELEMLKRYISSGTYGNIHQGSISKIEKFQQKNHTTSKLRYILYRAFPPLNFIKNHFPFMYKTKVLIPVAYVLRLVKGVTVRRYITKAELEGLKSVGNNSNK